MSEMLTDIADKANMIIGGYAFTSDEAGCRVIDLNNSDNAMVINSDDKVIETSMDDIEMAIVLDLYIRNKRFMEA